MSLWFGHVRHQPLFHIAIKFLPVSVVIKDVFTNIWAPGIIRSKMSHVWMFLEIGKDMINLLGMSKKWISLILG
jgi:hypothetical protein